MFRLFGRRKTRFKPLYTLKQAQTHVLVTGRPGAGKTSAYLNLIQRQLLALGAYCLHCCVKPDEAERAKSILPKQTVMFSPDSGHVFNPLTYTMARKGARHLAAFHDDLNEVLTRSNGDQTEAFWKSGVTDMLITAFELAWKVKGEDATYQDCVEIIATSPTSAEHAAGDAFRNSPCGWFLNQSLIKDKDGTMPHADFLMKRVPSVGDKAAGAFRTQAITSIQPLTMPPLCHAVNGRSTITPEHMANGYTVLDFDTLTHGVNGLAYQLLCSWFVMEEVLGRKSWKRPLMLMRDEFSELAHRRDISAFAVGRSQGYIGISALQTLPAFENSLGGGLEAQTLAKSLWGLHVNKVYCNNNCHVTNEFAAESIGRERKIFFGGSQSPNPQTDWYDVLGVGQRPSFNFNQQFHYRVDPVQFTTLRTGGPENNLLVDAIVTNGTKDFQQLTVSQR